MTPPGLPARTRRVLVARQHRLGQEHDARAPAELLDLPHTELDAQQHGPGWSPRPEFDDHVAAMLATGPVVLAVTRRPFYDGNVEQAGSRPRASHPLRIVLSREFAAKRRRTAEELAAAQRRGCSSSGSAVSRYERRRLGAQPGEHAT